jgi:hypothetical protein
MKIEVGKTYKFKIKAGSYSNLLYENDGSEHITVYALTNFDPKDFYSHYAFEIRDLFNKKMKEMNPAHDNFGTHLCHAITFTGKVVHITNPSSSYASIFLDTDTVEFL